MPRRTTTLLGLAVPLGNDCPLCGKPMHLVRQEPANTPGKLKRFFRCAGCGRDEVVKERPTEPTAPVIESGKR